MSLGRTIMLVDDELDIRIILRILLEDAATRILEVGNGYDALTMAKKTRPDLILLDWMMPGLNGLEVVEALRRDPETTEIPVIMLSSRNHAEEVKQILALGVIAYLAKPFSPLELLQTVERAL